MSLISSHGIMMAQSGAGPVDPFFANVISLCHYEGTNGSTTIVDQIPARTWSAGGSAAISTSQFVFGSSSGEMPASGGYSSNSVSGTNFGTGDFTIEFWVRRRTASGTRYIYDGRSASGLGIALYFAAGVLQTQANTNVSASISIPTDTWVFVAVARSGTTLRTFIDGVLVATQTDSRNYTAGSQIYVGTTYTNASSFNGFIDELRVTKGVARYTSAFTPPTAAFPDS